MSKTVNDGHSSYICIFFKCLVGIFAEKLWNMKYGESRFVSVGGQHKYLQHFKNEVMGTFSNLKFMGLFLSWHHHVDLQISSLYSCVNLKALKDYWSLTKIS